MNHALIAGLVGGGLAGAIVNLAVNFLRERRQRKKRHQSYWAAMGYEVGYCAGLAKTYIADDAPKAPLYRPSTITYGATFPALLADGVLSREESRCILRFYAQVAEINRGLDYVQAALTGPNASDTWLEREVGRVRLKASNLIDPECKDLGGPYYIAIQAVIDKHVK
jgi:hypothetical protein